MKQDPAIEEIEDVLAIEEIEEIVDVQRSWTYGQADVKGLPTPRTTHFSSRVRWQVPMCDGLNTV